MTELEQLIPLPVTHHCWADKTVIPAMLEQEDERLKQYVRITGAIGLSGEYCTQAHITAAVRLCQLADRARGLVTHALPSTTIDLNLSPLHHLWDRKNHPSDAGTQYQGEVGFFRDRLAKCKTWLAAANAAHETYVDIGVVLLDCEVFRVDGDGDKEAEAYNHAIFLKYEEFHNIAKVTFPEARVRWYKYGGSDWRFSYSKQELASLGAGGFSINLYEIGDEERTWVMIRKLARRVDKYDATLMMPWVALGQSYDRDSKTPIEDDYPLRLSYQLGVRLNTPHSGWPWNPNALHTRNQKDVPLEVAFYTVPFKHANFEGHFRVFVEGSTGQPMTVATAATPTFTGPMPPQAKWDFPR